MEMILEVLKNQKPKCSTLWRITLWEEKVSRRKVVGDKGRDKSVHHQKGNGKRGLLRWELGSGI